MVAAALAVNKPKKQRPEKHSKPAMGQGTVTELVEGAVYQLYAPQGDPAFDVVFFHGLQLGDYQHAWLTTWQADADQPNGSWPCRLLAADFPQARILSVSYDSSAQGGSKDLVAIREQLTELLLDAGVGKRPMAFVGHSLGGLVMKEVCNELYKKAPRRAAHKQALDSVFGLVFYSTPHAGSRLADNVLVKLFGRGAVVSYLRTLSTDTARLNGDFGQLKEEMSWRTLGFGEEKPTGKHGFEAFVVEEAAARQQMDDFLMVPKADHITVCKPSTSVAASYLRLKHYLEERLTEKAEVVARELRAYRQADKLFGRERELQIVSDALSSSRLCIITGGPGEGKSEMAYEAAEAASSKLGFTNVINVDLCGQGWKEFTDKAQALEELAKRLKLESWSRVYNLQRSPIVLFHNTEDILSDSHGVAAEAFYELVNTLYRCRAYQLITSRIEPAMTMMPLPNPAHVLLDGGLAAGAAGELLKHMCREKAADLGEQQATSIIRICEHNPLLLRLLGSFLAAGEITAQDIVSRGIRANILNLGVHCRVEKMRVLLSELLCHRPEYLDCLAEMSLWDSFTEEQASSTAMATPQLLQHMTRLAILQRAGLSTHSQVRYGMHVLVREAASDMLDAPERSELHSAAMERFVRAMAAVGSSAAKQPNLQAARRALQPELGNCRRFGAVPATLAQDKAVTKGLFQLYSKLQNCGFYWEAGVVAQQVHQVLVQAPGVARLDILSAKSNLGIILGLQGQHSMAETLHREALAGRREELGDTHRYTLSSINNLGNTLRDLGKLNEARALLREALAGRLILLGCLHPHSLRSMSNLGVTLAKQGQLDEAESLHRIALAGRRNKLGNTDPDTLSSMSNLGKTLREHGKLDEAEALHREALAGRRSVLGDSHPDTLSSMSNLGLTLGDLDKHDEAEALHRDALAGRRGVLGNMHPQTLCSACNLANTLRAQGKLVEAEALHREALAGRCSVLGEAHPYTLFSMSYLASTLRDQGKLAEADALGI